MLIFVQNSCDIPKEQILPSFSRDEAIAFMIPAKFGIFRRKQISYPIDSCPLPWRWRNSGGGIPIKGKEDIIRKKYAQLFPRSPPPASSSYVR
jgi:hypothetical protein